MTIDRKVAPALKSINHIAFKKPMVFDITPEVKLYWMNEVPNETARLELHFDAGTLLGDIGVAQLVNGLLLSGTKDLTSTQINHQLDLLGGFYESGVTTEEAVFTVYGLREEMPRLARVVKNAISQLAFHEHEVEELIAARKQKFLVNLEKTSTLAQRSFQQKIFHSDPSYSRIMELEDFDQFEISRLKRFFDRHYLHGLRRVSLVGNFSQDQVDEWIDMFGAWALDQESTKVQEVNNEAGTFHTDKEGALQSTIRLGRITFNKSHPDYFHFQVLNTILGDYFGSRLMSNLREDKGYTYGVGSMTTEYSQFGYFMVGTEVGKQHREEALKEIKFEFERLQQELVSDQELSLVKNYLLGQLLKSADGPYSMLDLYLNVEEHGLTLDFYNQWIRAIQDITPGDVQAVAKKYLNWVDFTIVSAG